MTLLLDPETFAARRLDGSWEAELRAELLARAEPERVAFLAELMAIAERSGSVNLFWFRLARDVLRKPSSFATLFARGLAVADASTIREWVALCGPRLGIRRTLRQLEAMESECPRGVEHAEYWLMRVVVNTDEERRTVSAYLNEPARVARRERRSGG